MRRIVLVSLFALLAMGANAQARGGGVRGVAHGVVAFRPAFSGGHGYGQISGGRGYSRLPHGYGYLGGGYGYAAGDDFPPYNAAGDFAYGPEPMFLQPPAPALVAQPARPAHSVVTNYTWPSTATAAAPNAAAAAEGEASTFGIVLKNGSTLAATTVTAWDGVLHYVDLDERHMRVSMSEVDRAATMKLNRERKLNLYLPATPQ